MTASDVEEGGDGEAALLTPDVQDLRHLHSGLVAVHQQVLHGQRWLHRPQPVIEDLCQRLGAADGVSSCGPDHVFGQAPQQPVAVMGVEGLDVVQDQRTNHALPLWIGHPTIVPLDESSAAAAVHASRMARWQPWVVPMTLRFEIFPTDLDATADFYTRVLGFSLVSDQRGAKDPYLALERDDVHIGAAARPDQGHRDQRRPPTGVELVLEVDDLDTEHRHVLASGWPLAADLQQRPWGQRDFRLLDPSGYYLRVTSRKVQA